MAGEVFDFLNRCGGLNDLKNVLLHFFVSCHNISANLVTTHLRNNTVFSHSDTSCIIWNVWKCSSLKNIQIKCNLYELVVVTKLAHCKVLRVKCINIYHSLSLSAAVWMILARQRKHLYFYFVPISTVWVHADLKTWLQTFATRGKMLLHDHFWQTLPASF